LGLTAATLVAVPGFAWALGPSAGASGAYQLAGAADGVRITVSAANAPVTNVPFDFGAPVAQAILDSLQTSQSFAALPYPGDLVVAGPGTVAGFSGGRVTPPNYPLIVQASHPVAPDATLDQPGYRLQATAGPSDASSSAASGLRSDTGRTAAVVASSEARRADDGTLRAVSASEVSGFSAGPLTIGAVRSTAEVVVPPAGPATKASGLSVTGMKVGDVGVEITPAGLRLPGSGAALPPTNATAEALARNGIEVAYLAPQESDGPQTSDLVVVSPAVTITVTRSVEGPVSPIRVTYVLGRSVARIGTAVGSTDAGGGVTTPPEPGTGTTSGSPAPAGDASLPAAQRGIVAPTAGASPSVTTAQAGGAGIVAGSGVETAALAGSPAGGGFKEDATERKNV